jgi:hypothetical protein
MLQKNPYGKFFFEFHARVLQNKSFINVESRLALIMKGMNNQFLFGIGLQRTPAPWFLWLMMINIVIVMFLKKNQKRSCVKIQDKKTFYYHNPQKSRTIGT